MVEAVTLREPAGWDNWDSVMSAPSAPARRKAGELRLADTIGIFPVWMLVMMAVVGALAGLTGLWVLLLGA
jgi:hypothetical protein